MVHQILGWLGVFKSEICIHGYKMVVFINWSCEREDVILDILEWLKNYVETIREYNLLEGWEEEDGV